MDVCCFHLIVSKNRLLDLCFRSFRCEISYWRERVILQNNFGIWINKNWNETFRPRFYVKVVRSPDGESRSYAIGQLSVQRAATWILEKYYTDFPVYNPYLERLPPHSPAATNAGLKNRLSNGSNPTANLTPTLNNGKVISNNFKYYEPSELGTIPEKVVKSFFFASFSRPSFKTTRKFHCSMGLL